MRSHGSGRERDGSDGEFRRVYDGTSSTLSDARSDAVGWLGQHGLGLELQERAALVLSELATNAVQASPGTGYSVQLTIDRDRWGPPSLLAPRGRGLMIVRELAEDVVVDLPDRDTVVVTATLR